MAYQLITTDHGDSGQIRQRLKQQLKAADKSKNIIAQSDAEEVEFCDLAFISKHISILTRANMRVAIDRR